MNPLQRIFEFPDNYFQLPYSDKKNELEYHPSKVFLNFILLFFFAFFTHSYKILNEYGFDQLLVVLSVALPLYYILPHQFRFPSIAVIFIFFLVYAIGIIGAAFYIIISLLLIFLLKNAKLPLAVVALLLIVTVLFLLRSEIMYFPRLIVGTHFVAAAFMFRGIWFFYESKHDLLKTGFWTDLVYFLIPSNICFTFFAIIDPLKFSKSYKGLVTFESGIKRIGYGISLVLIYRYIANSFPASFEDVNNFSSLLHFAVSKYWLVLNIAGIILCGAGTMNLFGFELASLFGNFLLATSFTELWRKINTNWRDFVNRVFYYPVFFMLKKKSLFVKIYASINIAFFLTWLLHDYQLFWLSGGFTFKNTSFLYWMIYGNLVSFKIYSELNNQKPPSNNLFLKALNATGIFIFSSFLWLLWESENISDYFYILKTAFVSGNFSLFNLCFTAFSIFIIYILAFLLNKLYDKYNRNIENITLKLILPFSFSLLWLSNNSNISETFPGIKQKMSVFGGLVISEEDNFARDEGYYENVLNPSKNEKNPWEIQLKGETRWGNSKGATRRTGDLLMREFVPNSNTDMGYFTIKINSGGFRDNEYSLAKDTNCLRIAIVGSSNECGYGINKEFVFETLAERYLDSAYRLTGKKIELLNFASLGSMLVQNIEIVKRKVLPYNPDVLIYFSHPKEDKHIARNLSKLILNGVDLKYKPLKEAKISSGATQNMSRQQIVKRVLPYSRTIMDWGYQELSEICSEKNIKIVWAFIPTPTDKLPRLNYQKFSEMAAKNNFIIFDLSSVYDGYDIQEISVSKNDLHPGIMGHQLITKIFLKRFNENSKKLGLN